MPKSGGTFTGAIAIPAKTGAAGTSTTAPAVENQVKTVADAAAAAQTTANNAMPKSGGTFTGTIAIPAKTGAAGTSTTAPAVENQVKTVADAAAATQTTANNAMPKSGGTFTGTIAIPAKTGAAGTSTTAPAVENQVKTVADAVAAVQADINRVFSGLATESQIRATADTTLQLNIDAEATARADAINDEQLARHNALSGLSQFAQGLVSALATRVTTLETWRTGLNASNFSITGTWTCPTPAMPS